MWRFLAHLCRHVCLHVDYTWTTRVCPQDVHIHVDYTGVCVSHTWTTRVCMPDYLWALPVYGRHKAAYTWRTRGIHVYVSLPTGVCTRVCHVWACQPSTLPVARPGPNAFLLFGNQELFIGAFRDEKSFLSKSFMRRFAQVIPKF